MTLEKKFFDSIEFDLKEVDFVDIYDQIELKYTYDFAKFRRCLIMCLYYAEHSSQHKYLPALGHYLTLIDDKDVPALIKEQLLFVVQLMDRIVHKAKSPVTQHGMYL